MSRRLALSRPYDERFRGYGKNKIAHLAWLRALGTPLHVHARGFVVHRLHAESGAKAAWRAAYSVGTPHNTRQFWRLEGQLKSGSYEPALSKASAACFGAARRTVASGGA